MNAQIKDRLREERASLDPVELLYEIRETQEAVAALGERTDGAAGRPQDLDEFLAALKDLWKQGEARPTHRRKPSISRRWRTREDPFALDWQDVLEWLEERPDITAREIFDRLRSEHPGRYEDGQLRTLQRRVRSWRQAMARQLIYAGSEAANVSVPA